MIERLRIAFERVLRGRVDSREGGRYQAKDRTNIDDPPGFLISHGRQDSISRADHSKEIYVEQCLSLVDRRLFSSAKQAHPCIVDQDVNPARRVEHFFDGLLHRGSR